MSRMKKTKKMDVPTIITLQISTKDIPFLIKGIKRQTGSENNFYLESPSNIIISTTSSIDKNNMDSSYIFKGFFQKRKSSKSNDYCITGSGYNNGIRFYLFFKEKFHKIDLKMTRETRVLKKAQILDGNFLLELMDESICEFWVKGEKYFLTTQKNLITQKIGIFIFDSTLQKIVSEKY